MNLYQAACNCPPCRESGWRTIQWVLAVPGFEDIVLYGRPDEHAWTQETARPKEGR